jgi:hypothetical protein
LDENLNKTYFSQVPSDIHDLQEIINSKDSDAFKKKLEDLMSEFDPYLDRRNRVLDHLLSRFGEQFTTDFLVRVSQYVGFDNEQSKKAPEQELIEAKIDFLKNISKSLDSWSTVTSRQICRNGCNHIFFFKRIDCKFDLKQCT